MDRAHETRDRWRNTPHSIRLTALIAATTILTIGADAGAEPSTLIVGVEGDEAAAIVTARTEAAGGNVRTCSRSARLCILDFPGTSHPGDLARLPGVTWVEEDQPMELATEPDDNDGHAARLVPGPFDDLAGTQGCPALQELSLVRVDEVWERGIDGTNAPVVAVIDTGFAADHLDLQGRIAGQYDYGDLDDVAEVQPMVPIPHHGTFMAGLIAADASNDIGRAGVAPHGHLFLQRVVDSSNNQDLSFTIHALTDLADNHPEVRVVAYSMIPSLISQAYEQAVAALGDRGILFVVSAGNCTVWRCAEADNDANPLYPQSYPYDHILAVASSDVDDQLNEWSHYGRESVDLFAPSVDVCSLDVQSDTATTTGTGTSYAGPLVAGAAALVMEAHPNMRTVDVARALKASVHPVPAFADLVSSGGRLDVAAAVAAAVPSIAWPPNLVVNGTATFTLDPVSNYGAHGEATIVILHDQGVEVSLGATAGGWTGTRFDRDETVELPDDGTLLAPSEGFVIRGELGEHATTSVPLVVRGTAIGVSNATLRMVLVSDEGTVLGAPYANDGSVTDATGHEAHPFSIEVTAVASDDLPADVIDGGGDAGDDDHGDESRGGCSTVASPVRGGVTSGLASLLLLSVALLSRRRSTTSR